MSEFVQRIAVKRRDSIGKIYILARKRKINVFYAVSLMGEGIGKDVAFGFGGDEYRSGTAIGYHAAIAVKAIFIVAGRLGGKFACVAAEKDIEIGIIGFKGKGITSRKAEGIGNII